MYEKIIETCNADKKFCAAAGGDRRPSRFGWPAASAAWESLKKALDVLVEILKTRETLLDAQREAAYTYQAWGEEKPGYYMLAIRGGHKVERRDGSVSNLVWGWSGIARKVQDIEKFSDVFNEARYNLALCRLKYAESKTGQQRTRSVAPGRERHPRRSENPARNGRREMVRPVRCALEKDTGAPGREGRQTGVESGREITLGHEITESKRRRSHE